MKAVRTFCDEAGLLLILDEIQTGIGRTGSLFAYEHYGIEPDIITLAKGLGGGVAIGALLARESASVFARGEHGSTFGGNPLACAAGYATLKYVIGHDVAGNAEKVGQYLAEGLNKLKDKYDFITEVRGRGLLRALEFKTEIAKPVMLACLEAGLLVNDVCPNALRFMPPLIITRGDVDAMLAVLERVLDAFASKELSQ